MKNSILPYVIFSISILSLLLLPAHSKAANAMELDNDVDSALNKLYRTNSKAKEFSIIAKGILVFPNIIKGGLVIGGQYGEGALRIDGKTEGYYKSVAASYGLQIGAQTFGYAMFFMNEKALNHLNESDGWEIGVGPSIVVMDEGKAKSITTTTTKDDIYVFFFSQKGLMAGLGVQGSKITKIIPE